MDRTEIVKTIKDFAKRTEIDISMLVVGYGAAAVMHGLRETTNDIDLDVHEGIFTYVGSMYGSSRGRGLTGEYITLGAMDFHVDGYTDIVEIDGIKVASHDRLRLQYEWLANHPDRNPSKVAADLEMVRKLA